MISERPLVPVFVIGCQRSGTTLTGQILGAHPKAVLLDEPDGIYPWFETLTPKTLPLNDAAFARVLAKAKSKYQTPQGRFVQDTSPRIALDPQVTHVIFKAPNLTYFHDQIRSLGDQVRVVALTRDPRDVVASMERLSNIPMVENQVLWIQKRPELVSRFSKELDDLTNPQLPPPIKRSLVWRIKTTLAEEFSDLGAGFLPMRYENLVANPEMQTHRLYSHLGLDTPSPLRPHHHIFTGIGPGETQRTRAIDQASRARWETAFSPQLAAQLLEIAGPLAQPYLPPQESSS